MNRSEALKLLAQSKPTLAARYGVMHLALFGSTARDVARSDSDVDVLVAFDGPATSERYFGVLFYLEDLLGVPVDSGDREGIAHGVAALHRKGGGPCLIPHSVNGGFISPI